MQKNRKKRASASSIGYGHKFNSLLCFVLMLSFLWTLAVTPTYAAGFKEAGISVELDGIDYSSVSSEPRAVNSESSVGVLKESELCRLRLYPGGVPFGMKFLTEGVLVVGFCDNTAAGNTKNPSKDAGLALNDRILSVNGHTLGSAEELSSLIKDCGGKSLSVVYLRNGVRQTTSLTPVYSSSSGRYESGIYVKDNGAGIGTLTYIVPESLSFGGLGHGICEGESGRLVPIMRGSVTDVTINGVVKGQVGIPGEVKGYFKDGRKGTLLKNTDCGVFGVLSALPSGLPSEPLPLCLRDELTEGKAYIYCTLGDEAPGRYEIEISSIDRSATGGKCFTVKVTDKALLARTGGIVQGMSGSPIIKDGKLCGAVTHVLINDPSEGFGIFIENMLNRAA